LLLLTDSCQYCRHKSRHRSVAVGHVWRAHRSRINRDTTSDNVSLLPLYDVQTHYRYSGRPAVITSTSALTDVAVETSPRSSANATTSTARTSDADEDRPYRFRLVPASGDKTSVVKSELASSGDLDLRGQVMPERPAACFQSWSGRWSSAWSDAGCERGDSADWLYNSALSTARSSFSYWSLPVDGEKSLRSGTDSVRHTGGYSATKLAETAGNDSFQKHAENSHTKCHQSTASAGSAAARFACPVCSLSYKRAADLNRHMKQKHWTSLAGCSSASRSAASSSTAREGPLNLTLTDTSSGLPTARKPHGFVGCDDTPQDMPLDLSTVIRTPRSNKCGGALSSGRPFDDVTDRSSSELLPPFIFGDSVTKTGVMSSNNSASTCHRNAASFSASAVPSFYASFTNFMENTYKPLWKSYFNSMSGQNATAMHPESLPVDHSAKDHDCHPVFSDDLKQAYIDRFSVSNKMTELPRCLSSVDDNNNDTLKCNLTGRSNVLTKGADVARPSVVDKEPKNDCLRSKDGGTWGQCPLCPFVCPHPLVMRHHLDVHDEPELQRTTRTHQAAAAASTCKTGVEHGATRRQSSFFDVAGSLNAAQASPSRAIVNCSTRKSTFTSDGTVTSGVSLLTSNTPSWLQACRIQAPDLTTSTTGKSARWNSTSGLTTKSAELQTEHGQAVTPFPSTIQASSNTVEDQWNAKDWQCSERWGSTKHVSDIHSAGGPLMSAMPPWLSSLSHIGTAAHQWQVPLPPVTSTGDGSWWRGWASDRHPGSTFTASVNSEASAAAVTSLRSTRATSSPLSAHVHSVDLKVM